MSRKPRFALLIVILLTLFMATGTQALSASKTIIRCAWGETLDPWSHPQSAFFNVFKSYCETLSNGRIEVVLNPAASLGTAPQVLDLLVRNTVQVAGSMPTGVIASKYCPTLNALNIPYLINDGNVAIDVMTTPKIINHVNDQLIKTAGIKFLSVEFEGLRYITNSVRPIKKPADLKGLKFRVMEGEVYSTVMKQLGASPVPIAWAELYTGLQTKIADGQENPAMNIVYKALQEVQKYMTIPGPFGAVSGMFINNSFYNSLSKEDKWVVDTAAEYASQADRGVFEVKNMEALETLKKKLEVYVLSSAELEEFKKACQPAILAMMDNLTKGDTQFVKDLMEQIAVSEKKFGF